MFRGIAFLLLSLAFRGQIRRRNTDRAKLIRSAMMVSVFSMGSMDQDMKSTAFCVAVLGIYVGSFGNSAPAELLRVFGVALCGYAARHGLMMAVAWALPVWTYLSFFDPLIETLKPLEWDGTDKRSEKVASSLAISTFAEKEHRVFLSFDRGPDIPDEFIDFLMEHMTRSGISVFGDGKKLPEWEELIEVIKLSKIYIPIISKGYASSVSCLVELSLMLECSRTNGQMIIPIFYEVDPSDVRHVKGSLQMSLKEHEAKGTDGRTIQGWGRALREVGGLKKFFSADQNYGHGLELVKQLVLDVLQLLMKGDVKENFVGKDKVQEVMTKLGVCYRDGQAVGLHGGDVRVVGICGTGGVGKTTLAKVVYKDIASLFDGCSYLEDVREMHTQPEGLKSLQNQLISDLLKRSCPMFTFEEGAHLIRHRFRSMRVLILLDDVTHHHQLEPFIGELSCFGPRSRIIVTTQDYGLINVPKVAESYEVEPLTPDQALFLFRRHACHGLPFPDG